ncbi:hypothetical protein ELI02_06255 [Rhizobium leguminosarum]|nr:hypothetical protein ELI32_05235 [Rhizobium leguminosarum]TAV57248.1 hypothetical protein ELI31_05235 [Rhizobium leguminosarum]TAV68187.1 hypothetical protein ELI30_05235 [Rhizobium leguminosarum]TAX54873.1 hypothetical protein ELI01_06380 [Rhizobium leguminosarum]TAX59633.1 hypothetical protein ELI02_06255 [Rhizobium leguminosarum]
MLLRREDAHPSRRFFYLGLGNSRQNRFALCLELLRSLVCAIPDGKPLRTFPGIALTVQICRSFTYMHS